MRSIVAWSAKLLLFAALVALAVHALRSIDWAELAALVASASWAWLFGAALLLAGRPAAWGERWRRVARHAGVKAGPAWSAWTVAAAMAVDHLTPTARLFGAFLRARWVARRYQQRIGDAFGSVLYETLTHEVFMAVATMCALVLMPFLLGRLGLAIGIAILAVVFTAGTCVWVSRHADRVFGNLARSIRTRASTRSGRMRELASQAEAVIETVKPLVRDRSLGFTCLFYGALILGFSVLAQWAVFCSVGGSPALSVLIGTVTLGATAGVLAGTPGGAGATESAMIASYVLLGVNPESATAGVLLYRALHYLLVLGLGLPALAAFELHSKRRRKAGTVC